MLTIILQILPYVGTSFATWLFTRGKSKVEIAKLKEETAAAYLQNVEDAVALWKGIAKDLQDQVGNLTREVRMLRQENGELRETIEKLQRIINEKVQPPL